MQELKTLKRYLGLVRPYAGIVSASIVFDAGMAALLIVAPLFVRVLFDFAYPYRDLELLNTTIFAIVAVYFIHFFLSVASDYLQIYVTQETQASLMERVFHKIQKLPLAFHQTKKPGDLLIRVTDDTAKVTGFAANFYPALMIDGGRFLIILAIAFAINPGITILALVSVPLYIIEAKFFARELAAVESESIGADSNIFTRAQEKLLSIKTIKAFGQERSESLSFAVLIRRRFKIAIKGKLLEVTRIFANSVTLQMWSIFLMWYLGFEVVRGSISIGDVVALLLYIGQLEEPIKSFINLFTEWKTSLVSMQRLDEILDEPDETESGEEHLKFKNGEIAISGLSFSYADGNEVLHGVDVKFPSQSISAIVGSSGSGKTTLANLLLRFFDPTSGMIFLDGEKISEVRIHELRDKIGIVSQEAAIFDGTVMDNILYGNEGLERGDAMRAAKISGASDFIERLKGGYDALVGTGGELLSAGERQRIAFARVLLKNPAIVILDEASSALDAESEYRMHEAVLALKKTKTVIVIAHRLSTIKSADKIFVLEDGRFVEEGSFDELLDRHGAFYRFYWRQFGGLASFRQSLDIETERAKRYGSSFCLAVLKIKNSGAGSNNEKKILKERHLDETDLILKKSMRKCDSSAVLGNDTILILLPEIDEKQMKQFFGRMRDILSPELGGGELFFAGARISKKIFKIPDELIHALNSKVDSMEAEEGSAVIDEEELVTKTGSPLSRG